MSTVVVKQLPHWLVGELQELSQRVQRELLHPAVFSVSRCSSATLNGPAGVVHAALSIPHAIRNVDAPRVIFDNPVFCRGNGTDQNKRLRALLPEKGGHLRLMGLPCVLGELGVLWKHVCQGDVAAWNWKRRATRSP